MSRWLNVVRATWPFISVAPSRCRIDGLKRDAQRFRERMAVIERESELHFSTAPKGIAGSIQACADFISSGA